MSLDNRSISRKVSVKENEVHTETNSSRASIFATKASYIQLFQLMLSDQSLKLEDKTARLCAIFF